MRPNNPRADEALNAFFAALGIPAEYRIRMNQIGHNTVVWVGAEDRGKMLEETDGLLTNEKNVFLRVLVGDCFPVLFYDTKQKICAVAHAGWRGVYHEIVPAVLSQMKAKGSTADTIIVGIGPGIRSCCYNIPQERGDVFRKKFGDGPYLINRDDELFLDLSFLIMRQLRETGIDREVIEDCGICTYDSQDFYSYRREGKDFGEFVGVIGRR